MPYLTKRVRSRWPSGLPRRCDHCGKVAFATRQEAEQAVERIARTRVHLWVYRARKCGKVVYHLTSQPQDEAPEAVDVDVEAMG